MKKTLDHDQGLRTWTTVLPTASLVIGLTLLLPSDGRPQGCSNNCITLTVEVADGSTPVFGPALLVWNPANPGPGCGGSVMWGSQSVCGWAHEGTFTIAATEDNAGGCIEQYYFQSPFSGQATCTHAPPCTNCSGGGTLRLYSKHGAIEGSITSLPAGIPAPNVAVRGLLSSSSCPGPHDTQTAGTPAGTYRFKGGIGVPPENNWGVRVFGDGSGPGTATYFLKVGSFATAADCSQATAATTESNGLTRADLTLWEPAAEPPDIRSCPSVGEPVSVVSGNVFFDQMDTTVPGVAAHGLQFTRSYNSANAAPGRFGIFGPGWSHSYERRLEAFSGSTGTVVMLRGSDGVPAYFQDNDADDQFDASVPSTSDSRLVKQGDQTFVRNFREGGSERYQSLAAGGRLAAIIDASGNTTTLGYDGQGRLSTIVDPGSRQLTLAYPSITQVTLSGPAGLIATFTLEEGVLASVEYADGDGDSLPDGGYTFEYHPGNPDRRLKKVTDLSGRVVEAHEYDTDGKALTSEKSNAVEKFTLAYEPLKTTVTDARGNVTAYEYTNVWGQRRVMKQVGPCAACGSGDTQEWTYDSKARVKTHRDGEGNLTTYAYDAVTGDLLSETRTSAPGVDHVTAYTYHPDGRVATRTDPNARLTQFTYGPAGPTLIREQTTATTWRETSMDYTPQGKRWHLTDPRNKTWEFSHNALGDMEWVRDPTPQHHQTSFSYDLMGRLRQVTRPAVVPAIVEPMTTYDTVGRPFRVTNPDQTYTEFKYDGGGRRKSVRDASTWLTEYTYDAYGRLWTVKDAENGLTEFGYDPASNLTSIKDPRAKTTTFEFDSHNRVQRTCYPSDPGEPFCHRYEEFTYDGNGRIKTRHDRKGVVTTYTYDGLGRNTGKSYSDEGTTPVGFAYDEGGLDQRGRLTSASDPDVKLSWTYDLAGQTVIAGWESPPGVPRGSRHTIGYSYDAAGNRETLTLDDGLLLTYTWDDRGLLQTMLRAPNRMYEFGYDAASRRSTLTMPNGVVTSYGYDNRSRIVAQSAAGQATITDFTYPLHDAVGNRTARGGASAPAETYGYDKLYRLLGVGRGQPPLPSETYTYDPTGNRQTSLGTPSWVYNDRNELVSHTGATFTYDLNGNLTQKVDGSDTWAYDWDAENRLTLVRKNGGVVVSYTYDPMGRRSTRSTSFWPGGPQNTIVQTYLHDGEDVLREGFALLFHHWGPDYDGHIYTHGPGVDEPLEVEHGTGDVWYYHADALGSVVRVTDGQQNVVTAMSRQYDTFGRPELGAEEEGYSFTGREWDPEARLYHYRARFYDPELGRFVSPDPVRWAEGTNFFAYVRNRPTTMRDPSGMWGMDDDETCLVCTVYGEARGTGTECQWAVASVILNRLAQQRATNPNQPISVCDIVSQRGQFDAYGNKNYRDCVECSPEPRDLEDLRQTIDNFNQPFPVLPGVTYFGNNTPAMQEYFGGRLRLTQVPFASCPTLIFFGL